MKVVKTKSLASFIRTSLVFAGLSVASAPTLAGHVAGPSFFGNEFTFDGTDYGGGAVIDADNVDFSYFAEIDQTGTSPVFDFTETGIVTFSAFNSGFSTVNATTSGLNTGFNMYAVFSGAGTADFSGGAGAEGVFTSFSIEIFIDDDMDTTFLPAFPGVTSGGADESYSVDGTTNSDDVSILTGTLNVGGFHVFDGLANGDFDVMFDVTSFDATVWGGDAFNTDGSTPIVGDLSGVNTTITGVSVSAFTDGKIEGAGKQRLQIPEPSSLGLLGLGILSLGFASRRKSGN